jgi:hypothetical protein
LPLLDSIDDSRFLDVLGDVKPREPSSGGEFVFSGVTIW